MTEPGIHVKGSALRARVRYVENAGDEVLKQYLDMLTLATRTQATAGFLPNEWYPFAMFIELCEVADRLLGRGDLELCYELGRYGADINLPTLYKLFFRVGNIDWVIRRSAAAWSVSYDTGSMTVVDQKDKSVRVRIVDFPDPRRAHCLSVRGWIVRAAELSGEKVVRHRETCRALGDQHCEFEVEWE